MLAGALAAGVAFVAVRFGVRWLLVGLAVAVVADVARAAGIVGEVGGGWSTLVSVAAMSAIGWGLAVAAAVLAVRGRRADALVAAALAGAVVCVAGGVVEVGDLATSQLPSALPVGVARTTVAVALGAGAGAAIGGGLPLFRPRTR
jgi:hypothetical protein